MSEQDKSFAVSDGEYLLLQPNCLHGGSKEIDGELEFYWIHFLPVPANEANDSVSGSISESIELQQHGAISRPDHLTFLFRRYLDDQESGWSRHITADLWLQLMLIEVAESGIHLDETSLCLNSLANKALAYIRTHITEPLNTSVIAEELRTNPDYLGRIFKQSVGYTITDTIHRQKIRKAQKLLVDSELNVNEISIDCGFRDTAYFRRVFKKHEGMSPRSFRQLYGKLHVNRN